ncbi:MAG: Gfo/Idh/MocA family oxidoreductase, partial [Sedimentisphaerales bacterium]|nr:Gfo/Idh/MocA family oxidoreductase [Sedimentisphaerales bacterium]
MTERKKTSLVNKTNTQLNRRAFIAGTGAAALSFTVMKPELVCGAAVNSKIKLGIIGCGSRGIWLADLFQKHGGYEITAVADYFQDKVDKCGDKYNVSPARRYTGLSGYKKLLENKLDAVAIITPPYFRPEQAAAAVEAGCHIFAAKPVAVDVPGCNSLAASAKKAAAKQLCFIVDFQTRADKFYLEAVKRVHNGAIGTIAFGEATYH